MNLAHPILTCKESGALESALLGNDEARIWGAMAKVGKLLGRAIVEDYREIKPLGDKATILVLAGKGNNAGDAFLAAAEILSERPGAFIKVVHVFGRKALKPQAKQALDILAGQKSIEEISIESEQIGDLEQWVQEALGHGPHDICIDGILGMSFKPPLSPFLESFIVSMNAYCEKNVLFKAAVDLPSGLGDESGNVCFTADFTYATGTAKSPLFLGENREHTGRIRYLNIGFFQEEYTGAHQGGEYLLRKAVLGHLPKLRKSTSDKRSYGHLFIISGSTHLPGAMMMSIQSALKSGVGLLTVFAPESLVTAFSAAAPEAMWVPFPETPSGSLSLQGYQLIIDQIDKADAVLIGPGLSKDKESLILVEKLVHAVRQPLVLDADALQPNIAHTVKNRPESFGKVIMTPHEGEFKRMHVASEGADIKTAFKHWCKEYKIIGLLKGPIARIAYNDCIYNSTFGGPVLARGGSGDILGGLAGGLLARMPKDPFLAISIGAVWQGVSADLWARDKGQIAVRTTEILEYLGSALRSL